MLIELGCDKFIDDGCERGFIYFTKELNVILGDSLGSNSIGKSTFLLIIDFVFGGNTYVEKAIDVQKNVGLHTIKFKLQFEGKNYYFSRDTINNQKISICDRNYIEQSQQTLSEYCKFLKNQYKIPQADLTFRAIVSRYFRVYQKDNLNKKNHYKN